MAANFFVELEQDKVNLSVSVYTIIIIIIIYLSKWHSNKITLYIKAV